jgi:hypothetical protein
MSKALFDMALNAFNRFIFGTGSDKMRLKDISPECRKISRDTPLRNTVLQFEF